MLLDDSAVLDHPVDGPLDKVPLFDELGLSLNHTLQLREVPLGEIHLCEFIALLALLCHVLREN